jgi:hypothetical protein
LSVAAELPAPARQRAASIRQHLAAVATVLRQYGAAAASSAMACVGLTALMAIMP